MSPAETVCLGHPRFLDPELASLAAAEGDLAAWQRAFARHGVKAASRVTGDFSVAIPTLEGGRYLAVDRFAIRSLCYRMDQGRLLSAPRADALAADANDLAPQAIFDYLYFHAIPSPHTIYRDVFRLPPGHYAHFSAGRLDVAPYWQPEFTEQPSPSFADLRQEFLDLLNDAVASRVGQGSIGCYLSGGTDSSTVAGMLTRITGRPAETYSIGFDVPGYDEMEYARIAVRHFGTHHHEYYIKPEDLVAGMPLVAASYDQPFGNSSAVPAYYCALQAKNDGIDRLLAGDGGDELFGGNVRYAKQRIFGIYDDLPGFLRHGLAEPLTDSGLLDRLPLLRKGASYVRQARVPMPDRMNTYNLLLRLGLNEVLTADFLARADQTEPDRHQRQTYAACPQASLVNRMLAYDWRYTLSENDLPKVVGSAALAGVDVGFPLLDDRVLGFSLRLPSGYKLKGLKLRWFFKEALRGFLPDEIITKKKHGFGLPFGVWSVQHEGLKRLAGDSLGSLASRNLVRQSFIDRLLKEHLPAHPGYYGEMVWILTMLEQWLRAHAPEYRMTGG